MMIKQQISQTSANLEALDGEIAQLQARLDELRSYPPAPGQDASAAEKIAHHASVAHLQTERQPEISGTELALADLQGDRQRLRRQLDELQAQSAQDVRQQRLTEAYEQLAALGEQLSEAVAGVEALLAQIDSVADDADEHFQALQENPWPQPPAGRYNPLGRFESWRPRPLKAWNYDRALLPTVHALEGQIYLESRSNLQCRQQEAEARRQRDVRQAAYEARWAAQPQSN